MNKQNKKEKLYAARIVISGRVQGVFYRAWTRNTAKSLQLNGWVRNTGDGKVEAFFVGKKKNIEEMIEKCKDGSKYSDVKIVKTRWEKVEKYSDFEILDIYN